MLVVVVVVLMVQMRVQQEAMEVGATDVQMQLTDKQTEPQTLVVGVVPLQ